MIETSYNYMIKTHNDVIDIMFPYVAERNV